MKQQRADGLSCVEGNESGATRDVPQHRVMESRLVNHGAEPVFDLCCEIEEVLEVIGSCGLDVHIDIMAAARPRRCP